MLISMVTVDHLPIAVGGEVSSVETVNEVFLMDGELSCRQMLNRETVFSNTV